MTLPYETQREIELFLLREAKFLDAGEFEAWLALYAPQGIYWMPSQPGQTDTKGVASIIYEDYAILAIRVRRLLEARALVLTPMPRTTHLVSNIEVTKGAVDEFSAEAAFICIEHQGDQQRLYSGRHSHRLVRHNGSFRIALKRVELIDCDGKHSPMTIPI
ncbi:MAG: aromatic-ring-hydroxylating dioxygenase subunit beta [Xanthobacteraceae bacterium]